MSAIDTLDLGPKARAFRDELREWLQANVPADRDERRALVRSPEWDRLQHEARLVCVSWPEEYGGRGLTGLEVAVLNEEFARARVPRVTRGMGESLVGPSIIVHGTDEQKGHFLPRIIDGVDRYCQGFSEPDAGSDLAALKTRGIVDGDELVITGQKVWTSWYWDATFVFTLCRTDPDAPKHRGISYVLVPVRREDGGDNGVEFRPIKQITGEQHFAETFYSDARAPLFNVIGGLHNGWRVSMTTLGNERGGNATTQHVQHRKMFWDLVDDVRTRGRAGDPVTRQRLAEFYERVEIMRFAGLRLLAALADQRDPGPGGSISKMFWSEHQQRLTEYALEVLGPEAMLDGRWQSLFLGSRSHTIWGGTAQIQRNIVGERVLGLPKEPSTESE
jgi:alkylation response protein AidB-like acyl-CoA dehydrogenase